MRPGWKRLPEIHRVRSCGNEYEFSDDEYTQIYLLSVCICVHLWLKREENDVTLKMMNHSHRWWMHSDCG